MNDYLKETKKERVELVSLPCNTCGGDCCGSATPFSLDELKLIKKTYPKRFKKIKISEIENLPNMKRLSKKGSSINDKDKCVFYDNGCTIYNERPEICRDYGEKKYAQCPFNLLEAMPDSKEEQIRLTIASQERSIAHMVKIVTEIGNK